MDILCVGLVVSDILVKPVRRNIFENDTNYVDYVHYKLGGDAFNVASGVKKAGLDVALAGAVGKDASGEKIKDATCKLGIKDCISEKSDVATATSIVLIEENGERHFAYYPGSNRMLNKDDVLYLLDQNPKMLHISGVLALENLDKELKLIFQEAKKRGITTSMDVTNDIDNKWFEKISDAMEYVDIFIPSLTEAQKLSGDTNLEGIVSFFDNFQFESFVVKLGEEGCFVKTKDEQFTLAPIPVGEVCDTTGAGDNFVAGFLAARLKGLDIYDSAVVASVSASFCISKIGAEPGFKDWDELFKISEKHLRRKI